MSINESLWNIGAWQIDLAVKAFQEQTLTEAIFLVMHNPSMNKLWAT